LDERRRSHRECCPARDGGEEVREMDSTQKIVPFLWFDDNAEEAVNFYVALFNGSPHRSADSRIISLARYEEGMEVPGADAMLGKVLTIVFELNGRRFMALDGGPIFKFNEAVSLYVECEDQAEVDYFWTRLSAVPESEQCGWLKDKFGLSWQIVPKRMEELLTAPNKRKSLAATNAMLKMKKIVIADVQRAFDEA
jgi:predicted 3-demethylubiquinone-9 3-methyltransferase (glyoxalase superfamily)